MLVLLSILLQVQVTADKKEVRSIRVDSAQFPVWVDFTRCVSEGMKTTPDAIDGRTPQYDIISDSCRKAVQAKITANHYKGISSKSEKSSHQKALAIIDGANQDMQTVYSRMPDVDAINARVEKMGLGVTVYDPIAHLYEAYSDCLSQKYNEAPFRHLPSERVAGWRKAIESCEKLKAEMKLDAESIMAKLPDFQDIAKRTAAIDATFDGHDEMVLKAASIEWSKPQ